jgi:hypothetical protein
MNGQLYFHTSFSVEPQMLVETFKSVQITVDLSFSYQTPNSYIISEAVWASELLRT